jgi:hypothetical protein
MQDAASKGRNGSQRHPERRPRGKEHWTQTRPERLARGAKANAGKGKLTSDDVRAIKALYQQGGFSYRRIGMLYGIGETQVGRIIRGVRWGWLNGDHTA